MREPGRRTVAGLALGGVLAVGLLVLLLGRGADSAPPPAADASRLVPASALLFLDLSIDGGRQATRDAQSLAERFPGYKRVRADLMRRLTAPTCGVRASELAGREAALALIDTGAGAAGSLVLLDTGHADANKQRDRTCGAIQSTRIGRFIVLGQPQTLRLARDLARGKGRSLASLPTYRRATSSLPADRVLDGWVSRAGVRRLLKPQGGLLGGAGTLLDRSDLLGAAVALGARPGGARITVRTMLQAGRSGDGATTSFRPRRQADTPAGALAYLGVKGLSGGLQRVLSVAGTGDGAFAGLSPLLLRARARLAKDVGPRLLGQLLDLFEGEVGLSLTAGLPAPTLTVTVATSDPGATARTLRRLELPLARILAPAGAAPSAWKHRGGIASLRLAPGIELHYAVAAGRLLVATRRSGVEAARAGSRRLPDTESWKRTIGAAPETASSLLFIDLSQLLRLAEQTGLNDSSAYQSVRDDLAKVRVVGVRSTAGPAETTAEILLSIP